MYINAPEGCQRGTDLNGTAYPREVHCTQVHTQAPPRAILYYYHPRHFSCMFHLYTIVGRLQPGYNYGRL